MLDQLIELDRSLFLAVNGLAGSVSVLDNLMLLLSSKWSAMPLYAFLAYLLYKVYGFRQFAFIALGVFLLVISTDQGSVHLFKNMFQRLRPCHNPLVMEQVRLVANSCGGQFGFISSHAANTFGLAAFVTVLLRRNYPLISVLLFGWAILVGVSRVFLGVHFPGDVIFGALFGTAAGCVIAMFYLRMNKAT